MEGAPGGGRTRDSGGKRGRSRPRPWAGARAPLGRKDLAPTPLSQCNEHFNGERTELKEFPEGFVHLLQRLSDMCYTVRCLLTLLWLRFCFVLDTPAPSPPPFRSLPKVAAFCADPKRCVRYTSRNMMRSRTPSQWKSIIWLPEQDWRAGGKLAPRPECLVDSVHTDLVNPHSGASDALGGSVGRRE